MSDLPTPLFRQLLPFQWRNVQFPVTTMTVQLQQDLAQHKPYNRDGAIVESTGRDALIFTATIPFRNSVVPAPTESFGTALYPDGWRAFLQAMSDKSIGELLHPELGPVRCKPQQADTTWDANKRDGVDVQATWIETTEDVAELQEILGRPSSVSEAAQAAAQVDNFVRLNPDKFPKTPTFEPSLADSLRAIQGMGDQFSLTALRYAGKLEGVAYRLGELYNSLERNADPRNWAALQSLSRTVDSLRRFSDMLDRTYVYYTLPKDSTFAGVAAHLGVSMTDLMAWNPRLLQAPYLPKDTSLRYEV